MTMEKRFSNEYPGCYDLGELARKYGIVDHKGKTYYQLQDAYITNDAFGDAVYKAEAVSEEGKEFMITWELDKEYKKHIMGEDGCIVEDCNGWCEDESNACDWCDPDSIEEL